jgi:hypothetical protein
MLIRLNIVFRRCEEQSYEVLIDIINEVREALDL